MISHLKLEWQYFLLALGFFTRIPVPDFANFKEADLNYPVKYFPLIGIIVGLIGALTFLVSIQLMPKNIAILISMISTTYLTGAFHEDGLADSADGLGGGWSKADILTIMADSRLGTYGSAALFFSLFAKFQLLSALDNILIPYVLIAGHAMSRLAAVWMMATSNYAKPEGKAKPLATHVSKSALSLANFFGLLPYFIMMLLFIVSKYPALWTIYFMLITLTPIVVVSLWWHYKIKRWLNGYTGDILGAMQQLAEITFYFGLVLWSVNH